VLKSGMWKALESGKKFHEMRFPASVVGNGSVIARGDGAEMCVISYENAPEIQL